MARTDTWEGLTPRAASLIEVAEVVEEKEFSGLCNAFVLRTFRLPDGSHLHEVVQEHVWSGGPAWFVALARESGEIVEETAWTDQEIADRMGFPHNGALPTISPDEAALFDMLDDAIEKERVRLDWALEQKYKRWKAARATRRMCAVRS